GDSEISFEVALPGEGESTMYVYRGTASGVYRKEDTVDISAFPATFTYTNKAVENDVEYYWAVKIENPSLEVSDFSNELTGTAGSDLVIIVEDTFEDLDEVAINDHTPDTGGPWSVFPEG